MVCLFIRRAILFSSGARGKSRYHSGYIASVCIVCMLNASRNVEGISAYKSKNILPKMEKTNKFKLMHKGRMLKKHTVQQPYTKHAHSIRSKHWSLSSASPICWTSYTRASIFQNTKCNIGVIVRSLVSHWYRSLFSVHCSRTMFVVHIHWAFICF